MQASMLKVGAILAIFSSCLLTGCGGGGGGGGATMTITGTVLDGSGAAVAGAEIEVRGVTFATQPVTDGAGAFSVQVPMGNHDVGIVPVGTNLVPIEFRDTEALPNVDLGIITLQAGFQLNGTVTDDLANPVPNADTNVYDEATGMKLYTPHDNTDSQGNYAVVVPAGVYRVRARPNNGVLLVAASVSNVTVAGTTTAPTIVLRPGLLLSGSVFATGTSNPLADVSVVVTEVATEEEVETPSNETDQSGSFSIVVPAGTLDLEFEPPAGMPYVAREIEDVQVGGNTSMGVVTLDPGFVVAGTVVGPTGAPVVNADIDIDTVLGGVRQNTPHDNTGPTGQFVVVVPAGDYTVTVEPAFFDGLVGAVSPPVSVTANTLVPTISLQAGVILSGTILGHAGQPEEEVDIDVIDPVTSQELVLPEDDTDENGQYAVLVPPGTWDVRFQTAPLSLSRDETLSAIVVTGPTVLDHGLSLVPTLVVVDPDRQGPIAQGSPVVADFSWFNPTGSTVQVNAELLLIDPAGMAAPLIPGVPMSVPPLQTFSLPGLAVTLPPVSAAHLGFPFRLELRFSDPLTGDEFDRASTRFVIQ